MVFNNKSFQISKNYFQNVASDRLTGIYIFNAREQEKATNMWKFNRGGTKNAIAKSQKHDRENNSGYDEHPTHENK